ncbi:MAG TPA: BON domain-containing protein [Bryobacteraceae bacterium]|nr:BON domain-containing protein [Bryobacteraceae bacterium]
MRPWLATIAFFLLFATFGSAAEPIHDDVLYDQVRRRIANDRDVGGVNVEVTVTNGVVALNGSVKSEKLKSQTEKVVKKVKGVKDVENKLRVNADPKQ